MSLKEGSPIMTYGGGDNDFLEGLCLQGYEFSVVKTVVVIIIVLWLLGVFKTKEGFYVNFQDGVDNLHYYPSGSSNVYDQQYL
jgi:hypothetical protein